MEDDAGMTVDCMACLVALAKGFTGNATYTDINGVTHTTLKHESYGKRQALVCTFGRAGRVTLVHG